MKKTTKPPPSLVTQPVLREFAQVSKALLKHGWIDVPRQLLTLMWQQSVLTGGMTSEQLLARYGDGLLDLFSMLGPVYGKAAQVTLSRFDGRHADKWIQSFGLDRLYGKWPALSFREMTDILDQEIPQWRKELDVDPTPLGVASVAQVHAAKTRQGDDVVVKVIRPLARQRMLETTAAVEQILTWSRPLTVSQALKRLLKDLTEMNQAMRRELDLSAECEVILRMSKRLAESGKSASVLRLPKVYAEFSNKHVLTLERFHGPTLSEVVRGHIPLSAKAKSHLAKTVLRELLIQVFELGLFHADPHAGNLILLDDGSVGLFDWGLTGELMESDRIAIAAMLRAVIALDLDALVQVLKQMALDANVQVDAENIKKALKRIATMSKSKEPRAKNAASMKDMLQESLKAADQLGIPIPAGLLMMAKTLLTVEGLARGIDPDIKFKFVAAPVLWRAARPGLGDMFKLIKNLPRLLFK